MDQSGCNSISFTKSEALYEEACKYVVGGTTKAKMPDNNIVGAYPIYASRGKGAYLWDVDGNKYIDYVLGYGIIVLGYCEQVVDEAAVSEIHDGFTFPLTKPVQNRLGELLVEIIPCAQRAHFFKTGSDATSAAVRAARIYTGRDKIVRWGYNGWHDWCCSHDAGIPRHVREDTLTFVYNDLNSLENAFNKNKGQIAALIMMPLELEKPEEGFLEGAKEIAQKNGALFILDEMRSGFRMSLGGAQEYYKVTPDLATFSKAIANGYAISALVGREDVMEGILQSHMSSTFFTNALEMAAAVATIERMKKGDVIPYLWEMGGKFVDGLSGLIKDKGIEAEMVGVAPMPFLIFTYDNQSWFTSTGQTGRPFLKSGSRAEKAWNAFYTETTQNGVLLHPNHHWFVSRAHTQEDIDYTLSVCEQAFDKVKNIL